MMKNNLIKVLYIDDEEVNLFNFEQLFLDDFEVYTANSADAGRKILDSNEIPIIISDQRMPDKTGVEFFAEIAPLYPDTIRIILTAFTDADDIIDAINLGKVYQYITKPFQYKNLLNVLNKAANQWRLKKENQELINQLKEKNEEYEQMNEELRQNNEELFQTKEIAEQSELRFRKLFESANDAIFLADSETGKILDVNLRGEKLIGKTRQQIIGMHQSELHPPLQKEKVIDDFNSIPNGTHKLMTEFEVLHQNGTIIPVEISTGIINLNDQTVIMGIFRDISERKNAERKLHESERNARGLLNHSLGFIGLIDTNGILRDVNDTALGFAGVTCEEVLGKPFIEGPWWRHSEQDQKKLQNAINRAISGESAGFETTHLTPSNELHYIDFSLRPVFDANGKVSLLIPEGRDITDTKLAQLNLLRAKEKAEESDQLKTQFLLNMSHEIKTPMNAINGFARLLNNPVLDCTKIQEYTSIIINSSNQLESIVSNILTISALETKQEKVNLSTVHVNNIIYELLAIFNSQDKDKKLLLSVKTGLTDQQSEITADQTKIVQVLSNLISNAIKFTNQGFVEFGYRLIAEKTQLPMLEFFVKDSGIGIAPEMQLRVFERFVQAETGLTRQYGGNGLGLSISKGFVELMGGTIWVQSELDTGSTFYFTIPYNPIHSEKMKTSTLTQKSPWGTILIAEDELYNYLYFAELLSTNGYKLLHAKNGKEAVEICQNNSSINLVLMDIKMPIMDGQTAAQLIKELRPDLKILAQSAYTFDQYKEKYTESYFDDYITKPIKVELLYEKIQRLMS